MTAILDNPTATEPPFVCPFCQTPNGCKCDPLRRGQATAPAVCALILPRADREPPICGVTGVEQCPPMDDPRVLKCPRC